MSNNDNQVSNPNTDLMEIQAARLAYIGSSITTLGDGISAIAAALALQVLEIQKAQAASSQTRFYSSLNRNEIQEQMNYFINELLKVKNTI